MYIHRYNHFLRRKLSFYLSLLRTPIVIDLSTTQIAGSLISSMYVYLYKHFLRRKLLIIYCYQIFYATNSSFFLCTYIVNNLSTTQIVVSCIVSMYIHRYQPFCDSNHRYQPFYDSNCFFLLIASMYFRYYQPFGYVRPSLPTFLRLKLLIYLLLPCTSIISNFNQSNVK